MKKEKLFLLDLETTGVRFWKNGIHQISGMIIIDGIIQEQFNFKVKPFKDAIIEEKALEVGHVTKEQIMAYSEMRDVYNQIIKILSKYVNKFDKTDKFHLVGYNLAPFDDPFFRAFFVQNNDDYYGSWFWSGTLDVMVLASLVLISKRHEMKDFKQSTVAQFLGIEIEELKLHDAEYDIEICYQIYLKVKQMLNLK